MKKALLISFFLLLTGVASQAQRMGYATRYRSDRNITRIEALSLQRDLMRYRRANRFAERDGVVTPMEQRRIHKMKRKARRDALRYRFNNRRRLI
ncbi:MAG: hypothetical protein U0U70_15305 [Chitinophagaceae bacterium]